MNYLAHAYLSFGLPEIAVGNLVSDFVKGKKIFDYPKPIQIGMLLHRAIDTYTDSHDLTREAKVFFKPVYGLYAGPITDIIYDHFLANDPQIFPSMEALNDFAHQTYRQLMTRQSLFPERFSRLFPYMHSQNWLYHYQDKTFIYQSITGLSRRASYMPEPEAAFEIFETHYMALKACYQAFFPSLKDFAFHTLQKLQKEAEIG